MRRLRVCVLHVPPFRPDRALGGAEVVAVQLVRALARAAEATVLHGHAGDSPAPATRAFSDLPARALPAFPLDDHVRERGHISPAFTGAARQVLATADVLVSVERTLAQPTGAARIACLGGVGCPHTLDVLRARAWDRLVVPSAFVARQVAERTPNASGVTVVENGLDLSLFAPPPRPRRPAGPVRLLVAGRPGWDKGFRRALDLARALEAHGTAATLTCFEQADGFGPRDFTHQLRRQAVGVRMNVLPWQPHPRMPRVYYGADLTLCLGDAAEGFGLVAAESVACGTPVLARPAGFLAEMLPPGHGIHLAPREAGPADLVPLAADALAHGGRRCRDHGRAYLLRRYGLARFERQVRHLVYEVYEAATR